MRRSNMLTLALAAALGFVGLVVAAFAVGLALPRFGGWMARRASGVARVAPEQLRSELAGGLTLRGSATAESHTEYLGLSYSTYQRWLLDVSLQNATRYPLALGNDLFLVESGADASTIQGVAYFRGQKTARPFSIADDSFSRLGEWTFDYPFSNYIRSFSDGSRFARQGDRLTMTMTRGASGSSGGAKESPDFGRIAAGKEVPIRLTLEEGAWISSDSLAGVRVVLPEISVETAGGRERFRVTAALERPSADARRWNVGRTELVWLEPVGLARIVETPDTNLATRIFAAHWLVDRGGTSAGPALARASRTLKQGEFLATALALLGRVKAGDLADHALRLLTDGEVPNGIRNRSAVYLGAIRHQPALEAMLGLVKDEDEAVARGAIKGLGGLGGAQAVGALLQVLRSGDEERASLAAQSLVRTGDGSALAALHEMAAKGRQAAFDALVGSPQPSSFEPFLALARGRVPAEWRGRLYLALGRSGGARALPALVEFLDEDPAPAPDEATSRDALVDAILETGPAPVRDDLVRRARSGNLRALQVMAGWKDAAARDVLLEGAACPSRPARLIALEGLSRNWPREGRQALRDAVSSADVAVAQAGMAGLAGSGDAGEVELLLKQLGHREAGVREAAASAIQQLGPGDHASEVLAAILETRERSCASSLVDSLISHEWRDLSARRRIADRVGALKDDVRFELVRLLRHLSGNAMGPEDYSEWEKDPESWCRRWREWAAGRT